MNGFNHLQFEEWHTVLLILVFPGVFLAWLLLQKIFLFLSIDRLWTFNRVADWLARWLFGNVIFHHLQKIVKFKLCIQIACGTRTDIFLKNLKNSFYNANSQDVQKAWIYNFACENHVWDINTQLIALNFQQRSQKYEKFNFRIYANSYLLQAYNPSAVLRTPPQWWVQCASK